MNFDPHFRLIIAIDPWLPGQAGMDPSNKLIIVKRNFDASGEIFQEIPSIIKEIKIE